MWQKQRALFLPGVLVAGALVGVVASWACVSTSPTTPTTTTTTLAACRVNNSAKVTFENRSSGTTYDIVWDGSRWTTLAPTQKSSEYTVEAGVTHTLDFRVTNSSRAACSTAYPVLVVCTTTNFWCAS